MVLPSASEDGSSGQRFRDRLGLRNGPRPRSVVRAHGATLSRPRSTIRLRGRMERHASGASRTATPVGIPARDESVEYYHRYIDRVIGVGPDIVGILVSQREETLAFLRGFSEEQSRFRYAPGKWSAREVLSHVNDCERLFVFRAMWFARGFESALPSFDQEIAAASAHADAIPWSRHVEEFGGIRLATEAFFGNLPPE